jgi:endopeptidase La
MEPKNIIINTDNTLKNSKSKLYISLESKVIYFQEIIRKTILSIQKYKKLEIYGSNELNTCIYNLEKIFSNSNEIMSELNNPNTNLSPNEFANKLQIINDDLANIFKSFGTENINDLIKICLGNDYIDKYISSNVELKQKYEILTLHFHPINYKVLVWKGNGKQIVTNEKKMHKSRLVEDNIIESADNLDCFDLSRSLKTFQTKVYGIKLAIQCPEQKKTLIVSGIIDDVIVECLNFPYVNGVLEKLNMTKPNSSDYSDECFHRFVMSLTLKDLLVFNSDDLHNRFAGHLNQVKLMRQKTISQVVNEFVNNDLYGQRTMLIQLLLKSDEHEYQYLAYLLYDLLSTENKTNPTPNIDTHEQTLLFDSLPWNVRKFFKDAMKQTIQYTNNLSNYDSNKIPLEQQICLIKTTDSVKEKAMIKLKEVKSKTDDSGSKARQYLDGLLKIPFGIYKQEPILNVMDDIRKQFNNLIYKIKTYPLTIKEFPIKEDYTSIELTKYSKILKDNYSTTIYDTIVQSIKHHIDKSSRQELINYIITFNHINKKYKLKLHKLCHSGKNSSYMRETMHSYVHSLLSSNIDETIIGLVLCELGNTLNTTTTNQQIYADSNIIQLINDTTQSIDKKFYEINDYIKNVHSVLDSAVHGHKKAKRQIERIIGQWINGEKNGYCFGFEGPPGVGKTSLAKKGIAECLKDADGVTRPFSFIAIGGSSNGSTLEGHNYTYVGSTWGRIVDILMDKKCMNPIIFIDELDKVSRTEHGRELIGILTHLIDQTQNDTFQDKYFNGIDLDLSKALFIFSYNDVDIIDKILLDRIHRIKFDHLTLEDKLVITRKYILPEIYTNMGLSDVIYFSDKVIEYIIEEYTFEPGVRKLKEIIFEIIGEINLSILKDNNEYDIPVIITEEDIKHKYLKDRNEIKNKKIHLESEIGVINGLWANAMGKGGVLPIETRFFPSGTFLELKLTGMQGDVMKESMNVAKTLAWSLLTIDEMKYLVKQFDETKLQGIHIHCPEGATPKDGPSAGTAITVVMYSLFTGKKIKNNIAITGEICLQGKVTAIGGLDLKILGGIRAGVTHFIYPKENEKDFRNFYEKYNESTILNGITFTEVDSINEVIDLVFE